jgi:hypothetical protein
MLQSPPSRPKVKPIRNPTLFEMDEVEKAAQPENSLQVERPYPDRHSIEKVTQVWDKTLVDRTNDLSKWVSLFQ